MAKINLRNYYPIYHQDCFVDVTDELAELLLAFERAEEAYKRKLRRNQAFYSLDREDGIEHEILFTAPSVEELFEQRDVRAKIHTAISSLPDKQAKRVYAHYLMGMSISEIARAEGVSWQSVNRSIQHGLAHLEKVLDWMR